MKTSLRSSLATAFSVLLFTATYLTGQDAAVITGLTPPIAVVDANGETVIVKEGDVIQAGWTFITEPAASITLTFSNGGKVIIQGGSKVTFSEIKKDVSIQNITLVVDVGTLEASGGEDVNYTVVTPNSTVASESGKASAFTVVASRVSDGKGLNVEVRTTRGALKVQPIGILDGAFFVDAQESAGVTSQSDGSISVDFPVVTPSEQATPLMHNVTTSVIDNVKSRLVSPFE